MRSDDGHTLEDDGMTDDETDDEIESEQPSATEVIQAVVPVGVISVTPATPPVVIKASEVAAPIPEPSPTRAGLLPRLFSSSSRRGLTQPQSAEETPLSSAPSSRPGTPGRMKRPKFKRGTGEKGSTYNFGGEKDILGIVLLEVNKAEDLPKLKNSTLFDQTNLEC